jgi:hypothetical protein
MTVKYLQLSMVAFQESLKKVQEEHNNWGDESTLALMMADLVAMIRTMDNFQRNLMGIVVGLANKAKLVKLSAIVTTIGWQRTPQTSLNSYI